MDNNQQQVNHSCLINTKSNQNDRKSSIKTLMECQTIHLGNN